MSQDRRIGVAAVAGAMILTAVVSTGCAIRVPSSEVPAMNLSGAPAPDDAAGSQQAPAPHAQRAD